MECTVNTLNLNIPKLNLEQLNPIPGILVFKLWLKKHMNGVDPWYVLLDGWKQGLDCESYLKVELMLCTLWSRCWLMMQILFLKMKPNSMVACGSGSNQQLWKHVNANFRILMGCNIFLMIPLLFPRRDQVAVLPYPLLPYQV
ncbi:hypothetical protein P8452_22006 [Trifolium repens]|nr:hypothetical protein P8452_22006 [Trifolium repens]